VSAAILECDSLVAVEPGIATAALDAEFDAIVAELDQPKQQRSTGNIVAHVLLNIMLVALVGLATAVAILPRVTGAVPLTVLSGSMRPTLQPGDLVVVRPTPVEQLSIGDVVTFQPESGVATLVTHRIIDITYDEAGNVLNLETQGDANGSPDNPLIPEQIMGRVWYSVPMIGHLTNGRNALLVVSAVGLGLVIYAAALFLKKDDAADTDTAATQTPVNVRTSDD